MYEKKINKDNLTGQIKNLISSELLEDIKELYSILSFAKASTVF